MKNLKTGISTEIVNGHVHVYTESEKLKLDQSNWWEKVKKKHSLLNPKSKSELFFEWFEKIKSIHIISNDEADRIIKKLSE